MDSFRITADTTVYVFALILLKQIILPVGGRGAEPIGHFKFMQILFLQTSSK